jgi:hypothetical protein
LYVFLQAYERDVDVVRPLVAYVTFYHDAAKAYETPPLAVMTWEPKTRALPIRFAIPAGSVAPGAYDCQVTVLDSTSGRAAFWRAEVVIR